MKEGIEKPFVPKNFCLQLLKPMELFLVLLRAGLVVFLTKISVRLRLVVVLRLLDSLIDVLAHFVAHGLKNKVSKI